MKNVWRHWKKFEGNITGKKMLLNQDFKEFIESLNDNRNQDLADLENLK